MHGCNFAAGCGGDEADYPDPLTRIFNQTRAIEAAIFLVKDCFCDLLDAAVDRAHHGHVSHQTFSPAQQRPSNEAFAEPADEKGERQKDDKTKPANVILVAQVNIEQRLDIAIGLIAIGNNRPNPRVDPAHDRPN